MPGNQEYGIKFVAVEHAEVQRIDIDTSPLEPHEVAGHTLVSLVSSGTEVVGVYSGTHYEISDSSFPMSTGYACVFVVESVGSEVESVVAGDMVFYCGSHQSYQRTSEDQIVKVPNGVSVETAVFTRMIKISMPAFARSDIRPPEQVLVTGLGVVGLMAAQLGQALGYSVLACDPNDNRRNTALKHGINNLSPTIPLQNTDYKDKVGLGLDCSGNEQAVLDLCNITRTYGEVVLVGVPWVAKTSILAQQITHAVFYNYVNLRSGWEGSMPDYPHPHSALNHLRAAMRYLAEKRITVNPDIYRLTAPDNPQQQYQDLLHQRMDELTVMFDWRI